MLWHGNTPTGVGKTSGTVNANKVAKKHPHGRGEDDTVAGKVGVQQETPPRAWGRQFSLQILVAKIRNTPTGVGKTAGNN